MKRFALVIGAIILSTPLIGCNNDGSTPAAGQNPGPAVTTPPPVSSKVEKGKNAQPLPGPANPAGPANRNR